MKLQKHWLLLILVLALILRLHQLGDKAPGTDEHWSIKYAEDTLSGEYYENIEKYTYPPVFNYVTAFVMQLTGGSLYALRLLMVLFGLLSLYLLYLLTEHLFTAETAILTTFLLAINPLHIMYSQHVRSYIFLMVLFLLATLLFAYYLKTKKTSYLYWLVLIYVLSFYTHIFAAFYIIAHFVVALVISYKEKTFKLKPYFIAIGVTTLLCALWLPILYKQATTFVPIAKTLDLIGLGNWYIAAHVFYKYAMTVDVSTTLTNFPYLFIVFGLLSLLFLYGCYTLLKKNLLKGVFLTVSFILPIILLLLLSTILPLYSFRYSIYLFPLYLLLLVQGIQSIQQRFFRNSLLLITVVTWIFVLTYYYTISLEPKWNIAIAI